MAHSKEALSRECSVQTIDRLRNWLVAELDLPTSMTAAEALIVHLSTHGISPAEEHLERIACSNPPGTCKAYGVSMALWALLNTESEASTGREILTLARAVEDAQATLLPQLRTLEAALCAGLPALQAISENAEALAESSHFATSGDDSPALLAENLLQSTMVCRNDLEQVSSQILQLFRSPQLSQPARQKQQNHLLSDVSRYLRFGGVGESSAGGNTAFSYKEIAELVDDGGIPRSATDRVRDRIRKSRRK